MTNETRSPKEIERDIERERAGLTNTLSDLQDRFSIESLARQVSDQVREHGGDIGRSVSDAVKRNPLALALTGAGLAFGIMAYGAIVNGEDYTTQSWVLIPPVWFGLAALWWLTTRWPFIGAIPMGALAFYAGGFFSDVYGHFPAGLLLFLGSAAVIFAATKTEGGEASDTAGSEIGT